MRDGRKRLFFDKEMKVDTVTTYRRVRQMRAPGGQTLLLLLDSRPIGYRLRLIAPPATGEKLNPDSFWGTEYQPQRHPLMNGFQKYRRSFRDQMLGAAEANVFTGRVQRWRQTAASSTSALTIEVAVDPRMSSVEEAVADDLSDLIGWREPLTRELDWFLPP